MGLEQELMELVERVSLTSFNLGLISSEDFYTNKEKPNILIDQHLAEIDRIKQQIKEKIEWQ